MKTLRKGRAQRGWAQELECTGRGNYGGGCGALLLVEQVDVFLVGQTDCNGNTDSYRVFLCPECCVETFIDGPIPFCPPPKTEWLRRNPESARRIKNVRGEA